MKPITHTELEGFLRDLMDTHRALDPEALRLTLARNGMKIARADDDTTLMEQLEPYVTRVRVGNGPLQDGVLIEDLEDAELV